MSKILTNYFGLRDKITKIVDLKSFMNMLID